MIKAVFAGSFDPVTLGHIDIISRAAKLFGGLTVLVMKNDTKTPLFSVEQRMEFLTHALAHVPGVEVATAQGLLADYARMHGVQVLVRGIRGEGDVAHELANAFYNQHFFPGVETVFLPTQPALNFVSSSAVKEAARLGADVRAWVPPEVAQALEKKF